MVKGISKRIVHLKTPPGELFSEAIFILKDEPIGISEEEIIKEALKVAEKSKGKGRKISRKAISNIFFCALGAFVASFIWILGTM